MENPTAAVAPSKKGRKRPASSAAQQKSKRFQDDAVLEEGVRDVAQQEDVCPAGAVVQKDGVQEAVASSGGAPQEVEPEGLLADGEHRKDSAPQTADPPPCPEEAPGLLVRQDTFTKDDGDGAGGGPEHFYIPVEQKENAGRREALFKRLSARRKESTRAAAARKAASSDAPKAKAVKAARRKAQPSPQPPPQPAAQPPALQRQGTFTIEDADDEDPPRHKEPGADLMDPGEQEPPPASDDEASTASLKTVAEMRVALATLRRGRAAAERGERAARERASRDALRTRAALQDLHARLAATREALHAEKDGLHRKLSADFRRALADRDAVWRQERERAATQVRALEAELRAARTQLGSVQAEAQRKATTAEAELRRAFHDQEAALRAQTAEVAAQRDSLQAQLRAKDKQAALERPTSPALRTRPCARQAQRDEALQRTACALRRELLDARRRHALLEARLREAQQAAVRRAAPAHWDAELSRALHAKEQEHRRDAAEAAKKHDALEAQLRDALRALREAEQASPCAAKTAPTQEKAAASRSGKQMTLALESHRQEEEDLDKREEVPGSGDGAEAAQARPGRPPEQVKRRNKRRREDPEPETEDDEPHSNEHNDERRRGLLQELERLRERNAALQEACRAAAVWRRRGRRRGRRPAATAPAKLRRVLQSQRRQPGVPKHPATETNAGDRETAERLMRHFHRLISLEPVSEAEEFPVPGGGLVGLGGPLGGSLGGPQSPLSSGPSSLSPTPGIGDVWNDLAAGCATSSGGSPCSQGGSSGSSSPGGESLGEAGSPPPEQLAAHSVMYWQLMRDHLQLQRAYQQMQQLQQLQASSKHSDRQARAKLEAQVYDLKRALSRRPCLPALPAQTHGAALADALQDVVELRQREQALTAELTELRDQNELLEFRLLELEGIVDKSSVCSGTRDVCTDTESDTVTEDSGLLSLGASDDGDSHGNPAHQPGDGAAVREKLALLASSLEAEEDRGCLQRALQLLDSYQQQLNKDAAAKPHAPVKAPNQRIVATVLPFTGVADDAEDLADTKQSSRDEFRRKQEFFNQIQRLGGSSASPTNGPGNNNAGKTLKHADCLQESGIFEEEAEDGVLADLASAATQTEAAWACSCHQSAPQTAAAEADAPFSSLPAFGSTPTAPSPAAGALSAEIQKLSQIRERFEEQGAVTKLKRPEAPALAALAPSALGATQMQLKMRELDFFRARAAVLEDKLAELERCSDPELRGCARLLERVAALERQAREAREAADLLVRRNRDLEEERCELEEAENDTRLRCQQLEVEVVQLREREGALEVELGRARRSLSAAHQLQGRLEMALQSLETRNFELEEAECELRASIAAVESALPAIVAFHLAHYRHYLQQREQRAALPLPAPVRSTAVSTEDTDEDDADVDEVDGAAPPAKRDDSEVLERLAQLVAAEQDMHQKIAFLEQKESAFQETLAAADGLWTEMELNYKRRLARAEEAEEELRRKVRRLEDSESKLRQALADQAALSERVHELEAQERVLRSRIRSLEQEKQAVAEEADRFHEEMKTCRGALQALQERIDGPLAEEAAAERRRALDLAEELRSRQDALAAMEQRTNTEISALQSQIAAGEKTMQDMEVTCAELREEVDTLEEAVGSLRAQLSAAHDKAERDLFHMESALASKDQQLEELRRDKEAPPSALNDEIAAAAQAAQQPEEDDDAEQEPKAAPPAATPPSVSLFRKSLQAFRNSEMMMMMTASKPATPPKPVPKKETDGSKAFASLPPMPTPTATAPAVKRTPPPLPPKNVLALKWARSDTSAPSGR